MWMIAPTSPGFSSFPVIAYNCGSEHDLYMYSIGRLSPPARVCRNQPGEVAPKVDLPDGSHPGIASVRCLYRPVHMMARPVWGLHNTGDFMGCRLSFQCLWKKAASVVFDSNICGFISLVAPLRQFLVKEPQIDSTIAFMRWSESKHSRTCLSFSSCFVNSILPLRCRVKVYRSTKIDE